jgi:hypothetical protein
MKIIIICSVAIGVLYWTTANPNSARALKKNIDELANTCSETVDKIVDSLTD